MGFTSEEKMTEKYVEDTLRDLFTESCGFKGEYIGDRERQVHGIDVIFENFGAVVPPTRDGFVTDIKANEDFYRKTNAFEIYNYDYHHSRYDDAKYYTSTGRDGWLTSSYMDTKYYGITWYENDFSNGQQIIGNAEFMLIPKDKLLGLFGDGVISERLDAFMQVFPKAQAEEIAEGRYSLTWEDPQISMRKLRENPTLNRQGFSYDVASQRARLPINGVLRREDGSTEPFVATICQSFQLKEHPINIIIPRDILREISLASVKFNYKEIQETIGKLEECVDHTQSPEGLDVLKIKTDKVQDFQDAFETLKKQFGQIADQLHMPPDFPIIKKYEQPLLSVNLDAKLDAMDKVRQKSEQFDKPVGAKELIKFAKNIQEIYEMIDSKQIEPTPELMQNLQTNVTFFISEVNKKDYIPDNLAQSFEDVKSIMATHQDQRAEYHDLQPANTEMENTDDHNTPNAHDENITPSSSTPDNYDAPDDR